VPRLVLLEMAFMKYSTIFFDFGDTLNHPHPTEHWAIYHWVPDLIKKLYAYSYRLGIISNTSRYQDGWWVRNKLAEHGILQYFEMVISSATYGVHKPDLPIFEKALRFMEVDPYKCVMVGDNMKCDGGAQYFGVKYLYVKPQSNWSQSLLTLLNDEFPKNRKLNNLSECSIHGDTLVSRARHFSEVVEAGDLIVAKGVQYEVLEVNPRYTKDDLMDKDHYIQIKIKEHNG
jgi:HAD superfamily hydrolase (TIGR01662 family)